jgi:hypothetical protein
MLTTHAINKKNILCTTNKLCYYCLDNAQGQTDNKLEQSKDQQDKTIKSP